MTNVADENPCEYCGKKWRVPGDAGSEVCQLCKALTVALCRNHLTVCVRCGDIVEARGKSKFCIDCGRKRERRYPNHCERCGKNCKDSRCAKCKVIVLCSCGCGAEARLSSKDYGKAGATARSRGCGWAKPKPVKVCAGCGAEFTPTQRIKAAKFCSVGCAASAQPTNRVTRSCEVCGMEFVRKSSDLRHRSSASGRGGRFCSKQCLGAWRKSLPRKPKPPKPPKPQRSRIYIKPCRVCGGLFTARSARSTICGDQCRIDDAGARVKDLYRMATQFDKASGRYVGAEWRQRLLDYLVARDGDKCGICRRKVDITLKSGTKGSRRGPSIDHVVPRSKGGSDDPANLRLTHWGCNQRRGNRGGNEQLALVG